MIRLTWWPIIIIASTMGTVLTIVSNVGSPTRPILAFMFLLICPGMAYVRLLQIKEPLIEFAMAVAFSLVIDTIVAVTMVLTGIWSLKWGVFALVWISLGGVTLQIIQANGRGITMKKDTIVISPDTLVFIGSFIGVVLGTYFLTRIIDLPGQQQTETATPISATITNTPIPLARLRQGDTLSSPRRPTSMLSPTPTNTPKSVLPSPILTTTPSPTAIQTPTPHNETTRTSVLGDELSLSTSTSTNPPLPTITPTLINSPTPTRPPARQSKITAVVYVQSNQQTHDLNIIEPNNISRNLHRYAAAPAWSADGTRIAFFGEEGINQLGGEYAMGSGIWLVDPHGGNPQQLVPVNYVQNIAWSPDNTKLAYEVRPPGGTHEIRIVDALGGRQISSFTGEQPTWSPNSQQLAIRNCAPDCGLWQINFDGSNATQITLNSSDSYPSWSPDGAFLTFTSQRDGNWEIYLLRLTDNNLQRLTNRPASDITPVFDPDGREIYLRTDDQGGGDSWRITAISVDGRSERLVREGVGPSDGWGLARPAVH